MVAVYVIVGLLVAALAAAWALRSKIAHLNKSLDEGQRDLIEADAEIRTRKEWEKQDYETNNQLREARNDVGRS
ncbi:MAG: hypothetical protein IIB57_14570, partial [Planctomycetes bacterium]|nr:hypothetical protein [Planctomycetota bacterium]